MTTRGKTVKYDRHRINLDFYKKNDHAEKIRPN